MLKCFDSRCVYASKSNRRRRIHSSNPAYNCFLKHPTLFSFTFVGKKGSHKSWQKLVLQLQDGNHGSATAVISLSKEGRETDFMVSTFR